MTRASDEAARRGQVRAVEAVRGAWALACLLRPASVVRAAGGAPGDATARRFTQVLGARHLVQAAVTAAHPSAAVVRAGAGVDGLHALTMAVLTVVGQRRRLSLLNAVTATGWAVIARRVALARAPQPAGWRRALRRG